MPVQRNPYACFYAICYSKINVYLKFVAIIVTDLVQILWICMVSLINAVYHRNPESLEAKYSRTK